MSRKRRQRSTAIRKRIEKKQREEQKARKKAAKAAGKEDAFLVELHVTRAAADRCAEALRDLEDRLEAEPLRGWTTDDLAGDRGLSWFGDLLRLALDEQAGPMVTVLMPEDAKKTLLERFEALEMASSGLKIDYDQGFAELSKALGQAETVEADDDDEDEGA